MREHPALSMLFAEVESGKATPRSLAVLYAFLIAGGPSVHGGDWVRINEAVNTALGLDTMRKIDRFRQSAWAIYDATAERMAVAAEPISSFVHEMPEARQ